jgi:hypothetical protein
MSTTISAVYVELYSLSLAEKEPEPNFVNLYHTASKPAGKEPFIPLDGIVIAFEDDEPGTAATDATDTHEDGEPSPALFTAVTLKYHVDSVLLPVLVYDVVVDVPSSVPDPLLVRE